MTTLDQKLNIIVDKFRNIDKRIKLIERREIKIEEFNKILEKTLSEGKIILQEKPWTQDYYNKIFLKEIEKIKKWFVDNQERESNTELFEVNYIFLISGF